MWLGYGGSMHPLSYPLLHVSILPLTTASPTKSFFFFLLQISTGVETGMQVLLSDWLRSKIFPPI